MIYKAEIHTAYRLCRDRLKKNRTVTASLLIPCSLQYAKLNCTAMLLASVLASFTSLPQLLIHKTDKSSTQIILYQQILSKWHVPKSIWEGGDCHQYKLNHESLSNQLETTECSTGTDKRQQQRVFGLLSQVWNTESPPRCNHRHSLKSVLWAFHFSEYSLFPFSRL